MSHGYSTRLVLYVLDESPACQQAIDSTHRALRRFPRGSIELVIRNLSHVPDWHRTARDRAILMVPTLEMLRPHESYLVGHLDTRRIIEFLRAGGLDPIPDDEGS